jgi:branched-chain amino acid transport system substrate-binding protein
MSMSDVIQTPTKRIEMRNVSTKQRALALVAVASVLALSACGSSNTGASADAAGGLPSTIKIGVIAEKTGVSAFYGAQLIAGAKAGIAEVKKLGLLGDSTIKLDIRDDATDAQQAPPLAKALANTDAVAILGPDVSSIGLTAGPVSQSSKIVELLGTSAPGIIDPGEYVWSMTTPQSEQLQPIIDDVQKQGLKSVAVVYEEDIPSQKDMNNKIQPMFTKAGVKVVTDVAVESKTTDFSAAATKVVSSGAQAVVTIGGSNIPPNVAKALITAGFKGQQYGTGGAGGNIEAMGAQADGYRYVTEWAPGAGGADGEEFQSIFKQTNPGMTPFYPSVDGYTMVLFLAHAIADAKSVNRADVLAGLKKVAATGFNGPSGKVTFPTERQVALPTSLVEVNGGVAKAVS